MYYINITRNLLEGRYEMSIVAENAKKLINEKGLKQQAVAKKAGYKYGSFNSMLNGRKIITSDDIWKLSKVLETTPNYLLGFTK